MHLLDLIYTFIIYTFRVLVNSFSEKVFCLLYFLEITIIRSIKYVIITL
nr:MAG TPA: hypothetical protein [Caudoviricetes sp.]DAZ67748.1 MAG TPA: hypothetical protein [Caudoviricetes sp.]